MKFIKLEPKVLENYLKNYVITYQNRKGDFKEYEIVSRNKNLTMDRLGNKTNAISIVGFCDGKMLISKEFRLSVNRNVYNFPCGLIDKGETVEETAKRELMEETNMRITRIRKVLPPSFSAIGISDEKVSLVFADVEGIPISNPNFADEEIEPMLVSKEEMKELLEKEEFAGKTQVIAQLWIEMSLLSD